MKNNIQKISRWLSILYWRKTVKLERLPRSVHTKLLPAIISFDSSMWGFCVIGRNNPQKSLKLVSTKRFKTLQDSPYCLLVHVLIHSLKQKSYTSRFFKNCLFRIKHVNLIWIRHQKPLVPNLWSTPKPQ